MNIMRYILEAEPLEFKKGMVWRLIFLIIFDMGISYLHVTPWFSNCSKRCLQALRKLTGSILHFKIWGETQQYLRFARYHMKYQLEELHGFKIRLPFTSLNEIRFWGKLGFLRSLWKVLSSAKINAEQESRVVVSSQSEVIWKWNSI